MFVFYALCAAVLIIILTLAAICAVVALAYVTFTVAKLTCGPLWLSVKIQTNNLLHCIRHQEWRNAINVIFGRNKVLLILFSCLLFLLIEILPKGGTKQLVCAYLLGINITYIVFSYWYNSLSE